MPQTVSHCASLKGLFFLCFLLEKTKTLFDNMDIFFMCVCFFVGFCFFCRMETEKANLRQFYKVWSFFSQHLFLQMFLFVCLFVFFLLFLFSFQPHQTIILFLPPHRIFLFCFNFIFSLVLRFLHFFSVFFPNPSSNLPFLKFISFQFLFIIKPFFCPS